MLFYDFKENNYVFKDLCDSLCLWSVNNVKWSCLFSGIGIIGPLSKKEIKKIESLYRDKKELKHTIDNVVILKCIYKKGKPVFSQQPSYIVNPGKYMWNPSSFSKIINPSSQAFAVLSLLKSAVLIKDSDELTAYMMLKCAESIYNFTSTYLKNDQGLYTSCENKGKKASDKISLKYLKSNPKLIDQVYMHESALYFSHIASHFSENIDSKTALKYKDDAKHIFFYLFNNYNTLLNISSRDISLCISSFCRCYEIEDNTAAKKAYRDLIVILCAELESRINENGEVARRRENLAKASFISHFRAVNALLEGYMATNIDKFKCSANKISEYLLNFYNQSSGIFNPSNESKMSLTIRDLCEIFKFLVLYSSVNKDANIFELINNFYYITLKSSIIVQSIPEDEQKYIWENAELPSGSPPCHGTNKAPVFLKSIKMDFKKNGIPTPSKSFNSLYSLYSSYCFLFYLSSIAINQNKIDTDEKINEEYMLRGKGKIADIGSQTAELNLPCENSKLSNTASIGNTENLNLNQNQLPDNDGIADSSR